MIVGVVGGRTRMDINFIHATLDNLLQEGDEIISGGARGVDTFAYLYAKGRRIPVKRYFPNPLEKNAYKERNLRIAKDCELLIAFPSIDSKGTWDTVRKAKILRKRVIVMEAK